MPGFLGEKRENIINEFGFDGAEMEQIPPDNWEMHSILALGEEPIRPFPTADIRDCYLHREQVTIRHGSASVCIPMRVLADEFLTAGIIYCI